MGVVTISRQYGSDGRSVGRRLAEKLGYLYMDKELIVEVARRAEVPVEEVERFDEMPEHPAVRLLKKFLTPAYPGAVTGMAGEEWVASAALPEIAGSDVDVSVLDEDAYVRLTQEVMRHGADQGNVVLMGRGGQALLAGRSDVLHVRVIAPEAFRIETTTQRDSMEEAAARKHVAAVDDRRRRYVKRHFSIDLKDPFHYHLVVNTGLLGVESAASIIADAARKLPY